MTDILQEGMVVLDIGAHAGEYALIAAGLVGDRGTVHAIEPQPQLAEVIRNNVNRNRLSGVSVHAAAISDRTGNIKFFFHPDSMGGWPSAAAVTTVPSFSLDDFVKQMSGGSVDFIKLDAGGNELAVLRGGQETLRSLSPTIISKLYHPDVIRERHGYELSATVDILRHYDYTLELLDAPGQQARVALESVDQLAGYYQRTDIYNYDFCLLASPHSSTTHRAARRNATVNDA